MAMTSQSWFPNESKPPARGEGFVSGLKGAEQSAPFLALECGYGRVG
jgi:hypothetical protein